MWAPPQPSALQRLAAVPFLVIAGVMTLPVFLFGCCVLAMVMSKPSGPIKTQPPTRVLVSRADFGNEWPLVVDSGETELIDGCITLFHEGGRAGPQRNGPNCLGSRSTSTP